MKLFVDFLQAGNGAEEMDNVMQSISHVYIESAFHIRNYNFK